MKSQTIEKNSKYFNKTYSNHRHSYQMDIFVNQYKHVSNTDSNIQSTSTFYPYYLILININTRYVIISHMNTKSSSSVLLSFKSIFSQLNQKIKSPESDEDPSFKSKEVLDYLSKKDIDYYIVTESQH
jgi:hypothetical protein